ncbi:MAG: MFS transporter [Bacteroidetes bacterium]|nr:MFS transporter [Bacteroidota bacterium]
MPNKNRTSLVIIFLTIFIDLMGFGILIPLLPGFAITIGMSDFQIGMTVAVFSLMQFLFNPVLGRISDRIGRRPMILIPQMLSVIGYLMFSFSHSFLLLFISRMIGGLGGSNIAVAQAYIADITTKEERSKGMGVIGAAFGLGFVFGPLIGAFLSKYGYAVAGFGSASFSFMAFLFTLIKLPESLHEKKTESKLNVKIFDLKYTKKTISHPDLGILMLLFFIIIFSMANIFGTFPILGVKLYHFSGQDNGMMFGIMGIISSVVQGGFIRKLSQWIGEKGLVLFGSILMMVGLGMLPYGQNFLGVAIVMGLYAVGSATLQPTILSMISKHSPDNEQGAVLGLNQSFSSFARVLGPLWGGFSFDFFGYQFPFLTGAFFTLIAFLLTYHYLRSEKKSKVVSDV